MLLKLQNTTLDSPLLQAFSFQPSTMPLLRNPQERKRGIYARAFDRISPQPENGLPPMEDPQKAALFRRGLLNFGAAMLQPNGGNFGASLASGLLAGTGAMDQGADNLRKSAYDQEMMRQKLALGGEPSGYREFALMAKAAGMDPGTDAYKQAAEVALGTRGRASSAGYGFELVEGPDGRKRYSRRNPRTGQVEIFDEMSGSFVPLGGQSYEDGTPAPAATFRSAAGVPVAIDPSLSPADIAAIKAAEGATQAPQGFNYQANPYRPDIGVSRAPEEEVAAKVRAEQAAKLQYAPAFGAVDVQTEAAKARARAGVEREQTVATRARSANDSLALLDQAETLLGQSGATGSVIGAGVDRAAGVFGRSTEGAQITASLKAIAGQLVSKMPRMEGPQSDKDVAMYRAMAGVLDDDTVPRETRLAALQTIRAIQMKYAGMQDRQVKRSGVAANGRRVVEYTDGSIEYAD